MTLWVVSQCTFPRAPLDVSLARFAEMGFARVETFCDWTTSRLDPQAPARGYRDAAAAHGLAWHALHLPALTGEPAEADAGLAQALEAIGFAQALGMKQVYLRSRCRAGLLAHAGRLLDACEQAGLTALLEPHADTPVAGLADVEAVLGQLRDERLGVVLELGHLARAGERWDGFYEAMGGPVSRGGRVAGVHLKNVDAQGRWAPWREGLIDIAAVAQRLAADRFRGELVFETELVDEQATHDDLLALRAYLKGVLPETTASEAAADAPGLAPARPR